MKNTKKIILNILILSSLLILFTSCSSSLYEHNKKEFLSFNVKGDTFKIPLTSSKKHYRMNKCTNNSYTMISQNEYYGKLFLEYISLRKSCTWSGLEKSFFTSLFKENKKVKTMKTLDNFEISNYNFSTYLINDKFYMNIIFIYGNKRTTLMLDYEGKLTKDLLVKLGSSYSNPYIKKTRFDSNYNESLVYKNIFRKYFYKEYENR